jgi:phage shock protein C
MSEVSIMVKSKTTKSKDIKRLYLSETDKKLSGVCGGIGEYFDIDPTLIRLSWIIVTVVTGFIPGLIAYLVVAIVIPKPPQQQG